MSTSAASSSSSSLNSRSARARAVADEKYSRAAYVRRTAQAYARLVPGGPSGAVSSSIHVAER